MTFIKDGIKYIAKKSFCEAIKEKDNSLVFRALDVWKEREPTKEDVLLFVKLIVNKEKFCKDYKQQEFNF